MIMRTRTLATTVCAIFLPTLVIYFIYYDSITNRTVTPRYSSSNTSSPIDVVYDSHKYLGIWQQEFNNSRRALVRSLFRVSTLPTPEQSRDPNPEIEKRRLFVKEMMKEAWKNYVLYAWGENELKPLTKEPKRDSIFGGAKIGVTIVDSMDTLFIMDMKQEFNQARQWLVNSFNFKQTQNEVSVFETIIRFVGGLLTCYAFTGDELFLNKSREVAESLLPAYTTETGKYLFFCLPTFVKYSHYYNNLNLLRLAIWTYSAKHRQNLSP